MDSLSENDWEILLSRIKSGNCTPFLGAGACNGILPQAKEIANNWSIRHKYPMDDIDDLSNVAQYLAVTRDPMFPKDEVSKLLISSYPDENTAIEETHGLIARLPIPVYITTNYDNFMDRALRSYRKKPRRVVCKWNRYIKDSGEFSLEEGFEGSVENPIVFHLHGLNELSESLVLTEDDYVDFLVNVSKEKTSLIPARIQRALTGSSLLFIGYSMKDWSFRVIFRGLISQMEKSLRRLSIAVQLSLGEKEKEDYLNKYFGEMKIKVFWGDSRDFIKELNKRWNAYVKK